MLTGCASSKSSVVPVETWKPAPVSETSLQDWRKEVKNYSDELKLILKRSSNDKICGQSLDVRQVEFFSNVPTIVPNNVSLSD